MEKRRRIRVASIIALVLALHLAVFWFLVTSSRIMMTRSDVRGMQIVFIPRAPEATKTLESPQPNPSGRHAAPRRRTSSTPSPTQPAPPEDESNAIHAPIDWAAELSQAAKAAAADETAQAPRDFGFPKLPSAPRKAPQFDWDYAATHRVEAVEGGGMIVHLNDRCVLVLFPLPFIGCGIGKKAANGDLLKHMDDAAHAGPEPVP